jgi:hypothetical protein
VGTEAALIHMLLRRNPRRERGPLSDAIGIDRFDAEAFRRAPEQTVDLLRSAIRTRGFILMTGHPLLGVARRGDAAGTHGASSLVAQQELTLRGRFRRRQMTRCVDTLSSNWRRFR